MRRIGISDVSSLHFFFCYRNIHKIWNLAWGPHLGSTCAPYLGSPLLPIPGFVRSGRERVKEMLFLEFWHHRHVGYRFPWHHRHVGYHFRWRLRHCSVPDWKPLSQLKMISELADNIEVKKKHFAQKSSFFWQWFHKKIILVGKVYLGTY